ncbi:hypothetical protein [Streptomyces sp. NPDC050759]|uniref:hypothetical protein n=1 Tax=Streptomyces sp. NPDC050759 TaxID=3365635 RepID=UPI0037990842
MWFWRKRTKKKRLTSVGVSLTGVSANWEAVKTDRGRALEVLHRLEDHRMLYDVYESEIADRVVTSAERLRSYLSEQIPECETIELRSGLREIQAAVRQFLTGMSSNRARRNWSPFSNALRHLRRRVGTAVVEIMQTFDIPVDGDLARIIEAGRQADQ